MYLPRSLLSTLYLQLRNSRHALSSNVLILCALEPDALAGCRILQHLLKRDNILYQIIPIAGYTDLEKAGKDVVRPMMETQGGSGGTVVCLGVGGLIDLGSMLGIEGEGDESGFGGVEVWVIDSRRPWNLGNVFGGAPTATSRLDGQNLEVASSIPGVTGGRIGKDYRSKAGGVIVFDDGDIEEELTAEKEAYLALMNMPELEDNGEESDGSDSDSGDDETNPSVGQKRKSWSDREEEEDSNEDDSRPRQRRRSNSVSSHTIGLFFLTS